MRRKKIDINPETFVNKRAQSMEIVPNIVQEHLCRKERLIEIRNKYQESKNHYFSKEKTYYV